MNENQQQVFVALSLLGGGFVLFWLARLQEEVDELTDVVIDDLMLYHHKADDK